MLRRIVILWLVAMLGAGIVVDLGMAQQKEVNIAVIWGGDELAAFEATAAPFEKRTGIDVVIESVGRDLPTVLVTRFHAGNPPDMAAMPNPGQMKEFVAEGGLVAMDESVVTDHPQAFVDLGSVEDKLYGIFIAADLKSLVWYSPKRFGAKGYKIPTTWGELIALSDRIAADGDKPWCIGLESGAASGWPGTDWIEDIFLRTAGPQSYDKWVNHEIEWTDPIVQRAWEHFGEIARNNKYVFGGTTGALTINFGDSPTAMFADPPGGYLHRQATFIQSFIKKANPDLVPVKDYDIFVFPPIDPTHGNPLLGAGDLISAFKDTPETKQFMAYLASAEAQEIWVGKLGKLGVNTRVNPGVYPDPITAKAAEILGKAEAFRFDGSDLMPVAIGSGTFWAGVLDYVSGEDLETVLKRIEESADEAYAR
jgi:alpha-glucoside transport system substrate-binding protein